MALYALSSYYDEEDEDLSILSELHHVNIRSLFSSRIKELSILSELHPNFSTRGGLYV
jgi:hypothetical protein